MSATGLRNERVFCGGLAVVWAFFGLVLKTKRRRSNNKSHTTPTKLVALELPARLVATIVTLIARNVEIATFFV